MAEAQAEESPRRPGVLRLMGGDVPEDRGELFRHGDIVFSAKELFDRIDQRLELVETRVETENQKTRHDLDNLRMLTNNLPETMRLMFDRAQAEHMSLRDRVVKTEDSIEWMKRSIILAFLGIGGQGIFLAIQLIGGK